MFSLDFRLNNKQNPKQNLHEWELPKLNINQQKSFVSSKLNTVMISCPLITHDTPI